MKYDETKEGVLETYGTSREEVAAVFKLFNNDEAEGKTCTARMMELINSNQVSAGVLLYLATMQIMEIRKKLLLNGLDDRGGLI